MVVCYVYTIFFYSDHFWYYICLCIFDLNDVILVIYLVLSFIKSKKRKLIFFQNHKNNVMHKHYFIVDLPKKCIC